MKEALCGGYLLEEYRPDLIETVLEKLTPESIRCVCVCVCVCVRWQLLPVAWRASAPTSVLVLSWSWLCFRVAVVGKKFEGQTDQKEKWYGTEYSIEPIPQETLKVRYHTLQH